MHGSILLFFCILFKFFRREDIDDRLLHTHCSANHNSYFRSSKLALIYRSCFGYMFFILATIYYLSQKRTSAFWIAICSATLAIFSAPAGFIAFLAVAPILFQHYDRSKSILWGSTFLLLLLLYLFLILPFGPEFTGAVSEKPGLFIYLMNIVVFFGSIFKAFYADLHIWGVFFGGMFPFF